MKNECTKHDLTGIKQVLPEDIGQIKKDILQEKALAKSLKEKQTAVENLKQDINILSIILRCKTKKNKSFTKNILEKVAKELEDEIKHPTPDSDEILKCSLKLCIAHRLEIMGDEANWILCDNCEQWYHADCSLILSNAEQGEKNNQLWSCLKVCHIQKANLAERK